MRPDSPRELGGRAFPLGGRRLVPAILTAAALVSATLLFLAYRNSTRPLLQETSIYLLCAGLLVAGLASALVLVWTLLGDVKRSEAEIRASREQFARVIEGSSDSFWDWHVPSGATQRNRRWAEMLGYTPDEIEATHDQWVRLVHPDDFKEAIRVLHEYWAGRISDYELEMRLKHKDGHWHWVLTRGKVGSWVAPGQPEWMTGTNVDIHAHRSAKQLLALQFEATELLSRSDTLEHGGEKILQRICENLNYSLGALWLETAGGTGLQMACVWHNPLHGTTAFVDARRAQPPAPGPGLPARVLQSGGLEWTASLHNDTSGASSKTGTEINSGFALPLDTGQQRIGALEFLGRGIPQPDGKLLEALTKIAGQIAIFRQHKQAEATLRERENMLRSLGDNLPAGAIYQVLLEGATGRRSLNYISEGIEQLTGVSSSGMAANPDLFYKFEPEDLALFRKASDESVRTLNVFEAEVRYRTTHNGVKWLHYRSAPRRLPDGNTVWDGIVSDVTDRKSAEERVKRYEFIVNSIAELICLVNRDFVYEALNDAWCNALQRKRPEMIGKTVSEVLGEAVFAETIKPHVERCFEGKPEFYQVWMELGVYGRRHCSIAVYPYWGEPGRVTHAIMVTRDTTAENAAESQLIRAIQAAEEANRAKSVFLANMSHEIRTPMNAIIGMGYLLKQTSLSDKQNDYASKIDAAARSLLRIINDILDFSKVEAGKIDIETEEFNLNEVLSNLVQMTTTQVQQKGLDFKVHVAPGTPQSLLGDPLRLGQVLVNLTSNAIKFTENGGVAITVEVVQRDNRFIILRFSVTDTGIGLNDQQLKRLFEPFSQADVTTTRRYGGTGLGLAISKRYVEMMGGKIEVQSRMGEGSTFSFTAQFTHPTKNSRRVHAIRMLVSGRRALIVDHDESSRTTMTAILKQLSFDVTAVDSGESAIKEVKQVKDTSSPRFDLVLYDHSLPGVDWTIAARRIRDSFGGVPPAMVMLVSPEVGEVDSQAGSTYFDKHLQKPGTRSELYDAIMTAFAKSAQRNAQARTEELHVPAADKILEGKRILLVEDNEINQQVAEEILLLAGCQVKIAGNGVEALSILLNDSPEVKYDAVLMDLQMPEMDGYKVTRCIRADPSFEHLPIIAMTADAVAGVREACLSAGMNDYLTKPIKFDELYSTLAKRIRANVVNEPEPPPAKRVQPAVVVAAAQPPAPPAPTAPVAPFSAAERRSSALIPAVQTAPPPSRKPAAQPADLHVDSGIARVGGNRALYFRLLQHFGAKYGQMADEIDAMLARGEKDNALRYLHTIKGVAANLGVDTLSQNAARWEAALKADLPPAALNESRENFIQIVSESLGKISNTLASNKSESPRAPAPAESPAPRIQPEKLDRLAAMLESSDISAARVARDIGTEIGEGKQADEFRTIVELIQQFKFPDAAAALKSWRAGNA